MSAAELIYKVSTVYNGQTKAQRWDISKPLRLPQPLHYKLKIQNQKIYSVSGTELNLLGDLGGKTELRLNSNCSVIIEKLHFENSVVEHKEAQELIGCLYYLSIQGCGALRSEVQQFKRATTLWASELKVAYVKQSENGLNITCKTSGIKVTKSGRIEDLMVGQTYYFKNSELSDVKLSLEHYWWKFKPVTRTYELFDSPPSSYEEDSPVGKVIGMMIGAYLIASLGNFVFKMWNGGSNNSSFPTAEVKQPETVAVETKPEEMKLPEKFVQERKAHVAEIQNKIVEASKIPDVQESKPDGAKQAILGDGKLPPGGQKDGPMAPAAAKGNGLPPAENGGALGTKIGKLSDAAALPKTHKVHVGNGLPKDALFTKQKIQTLATTDKAGASTKIIALEQDQARKLLARKSQALKSAFGSVLGYLDNQAPDPLAVTDPNAKSDGKLPKKGGLLVAPNGTGSGKTNDDRVRVLGQVGSEAGRGIVGGAGGSPNGAVGGYGLSTRYKGTGTNEGSGIGGSKSGNLFVDFDALNSTGEFAGSISEGLTKAEVGKVIHEHSAEIRECYENSLIKNPGLKGRMTVDFTISPAGFVNKSAVKESQFQNSFLGGCLQGRMKTWGFPKPRNGVFVQVTYPFNFRTLGGAP